jgi:hypothetical protein
MRRHGFTAREAMGWLRIMRPGSVIGEQQHYLCAAAGDAAARPTGCGSGGMRSCAEVAAEVAAGMERRGSFRAQGVCAVGLPDASALDEDGSAPRPGPRCRDPAFRAE